MSHSSSSSFAFILCDVAAEILCCSSDITPVKHVVFVARTKPTGAITDVLEKGVISCR